MSPSARKPLVPDLVLAFLFVAMAAITTPHDPNEIALILLFGALQFAESVMLPSLGRQRARVLWNLGKVVVAYALIGTTNGIESEYYWMLLFPVISTAATLGVGSTLAFTVVACAAYLSFLHPVFVNYTQQKLDPQGIAELVRRVLFLGISGMLVNILAQALRSQSERDQLLAEELAESNRNLQAAEAQARRAERLAAIGQLTAGLAHELRNPLGTIKASADMLERNLPAGDQIAQELAGYISSEVDRTNSLVSRFLDFAKPLEIRRSRGDLNDVVAAAVTASRRDASQNGVSVDFRPSAKSIVLPLDAELMERVFFNLILNAIQASPAGSVVEIESFLDGAFACVDVCDRGPGIQPDERESIFNPFFTTKPNGTGLGLAIVAKIVSEHRGRTDVESKPGVGSKFCVCLPVAEQEAN